MEEEQEAQEEDQTKSLILYRRFLSFVKENFALRLLKKVFRRMIPTFCFLFALLLVGSAMILSISASVCMKTHKKIVTVEELKALGEHFDAVLVLGCKVYEDGTLSARLADRVSVALSVYESGVCEKILMSGDSEYEDYDEVGAMKRVAMDAGVLDEEILLDSYGLSTYESMIRFRDVFRGKRVIIVTQEYHLYRAIYIAEKIGLEAYGVSASLRSYQKQFFMETREILARCKDVWMSLVQPDPKWK